MAKIIITIGREYGSGGREIGEKIAERWGIPCYDKLIVDRTVKESNIDPDLVKKLEENHKEVMRHTVINTYYGHHGMFGLLNEPSIATKIDVARTNAIKDLSKNGSCVMIGRAADYVLKDEENIISLFICADRECRIARIMERQSVSRNKAKKLIKDVDKNRSEFYNFNTDKKWGVASSYDLTINSSLLGIDDTVEAILSYIYTYLKNHKLERFSKEGE